jgi:hypothetical protein
LVKCNYGKMREVSYLDKRIDVVRRKCMGLWKTINEQWRHKYGVKRKSIYEMDRLVDEANYWEEVLEKLKHRKSDGKIEW